MPFVPTEDYLKNLLVDARTHVASGDYDGILKAAKVGLVAAPMIPTSATVYGDITQPTYSGYAEQSATFGAPYRRDEGGIACQSALLKFQEASTITPTQVYGVYVTDGAVSPTLLGVEMFKDGPRSLNDALDAVYVSPQVALGGPNYGEGQYSN